MGNLLANYCGYQIIQLAESDNIAREISPFLGRRDVYNELGYPIFNESEKQFFLVMDGDKAAGLSAARVKDDKLILCNTYIEKEYRNQGIYDFLFDLRIERFPDTKLITGIATELSKGTFIRKGFSPVKETRRYTFFERRR